MVGEMRSNVIGFNPDHWRITPEKAGTFSDEDLPRRIAWARVCVDGALTVDPQYHQSDVYEANLDILLAEQTRREKLQLA